VNIVGLMIPAVALLFAAGCGQKKVTECNSLITIINANVSTLEKAPKVETDVGGDLKSMAEIMDKAAGDAAKVELTLPELKKVSTDYQAMAKDVAKAAREMSVAAESHDAAKITTAQQAMEKAVKQEDPLIEGLNKFCQQP
jgi:hypothetical protein